MFLDEIKLTLEAGDGGPGIVSFFVGKNGPDGGKGGRGGSIYITINQQLSSFNKYAGKQLFKAESGGSGGKNRREGKAGKDLILDFPIGTSFVNLETGEERELNNSKPQILICKGGKGGLGNDSYKTSTNRVPRRADLGEKGKSRTFTIILRLIADYGLIGLPNAGKSSLLNVLTAANVKTAAYPFTTLEPNLGVYHEKILADIPGLIEGASKGKGLGIKFLKHIEKVKLILHCISLESDDVVKDYQTVVKELKQYNPKLLKKEQVILLTKSDLASKEMIEEKKKTLEQFEHKIANISIYEEKSLRVLKEIIAK